MYCSNCGKKMSPDGKFCASCGKKTGSKNISKELKLPEIKSLEFFRKIPIKPSKALVNGGFLILGIATAYFCVSKVFIPFYGEEMLSKALFYVESQNYAEAVEAFIGAESAGVLTEEASIYKARAYFNLGEYEKAKEILEKASNDLDSLKLLALIYKISENILEYQQTLQKIIEIAPNDEAPYLELAASYRQKEMLDSAANTLEKLLSRRKSPEASTLLYNIHVEAYAKSSSLEKAAAVKEEAFANLSSREIISLDTAEGETVGISPSGKYILSKTDRFIDIYSFDGGNLKFLSSFKIPANYEVDFAMAAWNENEDKLAFYNASAEEFVHDSSIYIYDLESFELKNLTDPQENYIHFMEGTDVYILDTIPCFSSDGEYIYFARKTIKGNFLSEVNIDTGEITNLYEPANGGWIDYAVIEHGGKIYFSVTGENRNDLWGLYIYENETARKLKFEYDDRYYDLALKSISPGGKYLLYYVTVACQNNSFYFKILDLENMKLKEAYKQDIASVNSKMYALNNSDILGMSVKFITRNAEFSKDGKSLIIAEDSLDYWGKTIRTVNIDSGNTDFVYTSMEKDEGGFGFAGENIGGKTVFETEKGIVVWDKGFKLVVR